jgi:hypothetical protein
MPGNSPVLLSVIGLLMPAAVWGRFVTSRANPCVLTVVSTASTLRRLGLVAKVG